MFNKEKFGKILVPMVTPFKENGDVDYDAMVKNGEILLEKGWADSFILTGTTGEFFTMTSAERIKIFETMYKAFNGRIPLMAGTGAASTREALELTKAAQDIGYDTVMIVAPYYTRPSQKEIRNHFQTIARNVSVDILIYNIPIFTGVNTSAEMVAELAKEPNIVGIKEEAELNAKQMTDFINATPEDFIIYNGDDTMVLESFVQGFERIGGVISGGAQIVGDQIRSMIDLLHEGKVKEASIIQRRLFPMSSSNVSALVLSPHTKRCLPSFHRSPVLVIAGFSSSAFTSKSSSCTPSARASLNRSSISAGSKPVSEMSKSSPCNSVMSKASLSLSHSPLILFSAMLRAFSLSSESSTTTQSRSA